ncbi:MAG TPA: hypothetical protein VEU52_06065 [Candidatus Limnocylindrales bacterium]|nr:hypothetical protein [Candidatus Limnocylindrales bacterium]
MPFIRGRYHINPIAGKALEAAREAEAALQALEQQAQGHALDQGDGFAYENSEPNPPQDEKGPVHRVEIEAAELVPSHSGRAARGFVARVHRHPSAGSAGAGDGIAGNHAAPGASKFTLNSTLPARSETHVFSDHRDLLNFLADEFAHDCTKR